MLYKPFNDLQLSALGMGNMRLPTLGEHGPIDREKAQQIIDYAYSHGINYYDTAYPYHDGESERFLGEAMKKFPRDSYYLATKFPGFMFKKGQHPKEYFEEQLRRCQTDYFDFYLLHNLNPGLFELYTDESIIGYFEEQQRAGRIRYFGFSSHADADTLAKFTALRKWDFAQIELNYLDWTMQDAKRQYEILTQHGIPIVVMEPVRGGRLASLTPEADALLKAAEPDRSIASWAFRWLMRLENVKVVLSGMTEMSQIEDNVHTFERSDPLSDEMAARLMQACDLFKTKFHVPCTACSYCTHDCPQGLDIPNFMRLYNEFVIADFPFVLYSLNDVDEAKRPASCLACGLCAGNCPQSIPIPEIIGKLADAYANMPEDR